MQSYFSYIDSMMADIRVNARRMYGCEGILMASRTSTHGLNNHFDATWPMTFWTAGAGWAAQFHYDYWLYTGDREFLRNRALPFMKEAARFYEGFLIEDGNGRYLFSPSYSPENNPGNSKSQACVNATMDIAVARELFRNLIAACVELKVESSNVAKWRAMLAKLPDYMVNGDGAVKEWTHPDLEDNYAHRHCSHLYPLFSGLAPDIASSPELKKAFQRAVDLRVAERRKERGGGVMAFGLVQLGLSAASLGDAGTSSFVLERLAKNFYFSNFASSHDPGSIFNVDLSGGLPAILIQCLVRSEPGLIQLLPAVPTQIPTGRISGVLCRGQITVADLRWAPDRAVVSLESRRAQTIALRTPRVIRSASLTEGKKSERLSAVADAIPKLELAAGKRSEIDLRF